MHSKPEKEMTEEELEKKENDRKHFHSYRDANKDGYIDRVMKMTPFCNFDINYPPMNQKGCCHLVCAIFQTWKKSGNWRLSLEKWLKVLSFFGSDIKCFISEILFILVKSLIHSCLYKSSAS